MTPKAHDIFTHYQNVCVAAFVRMGNFESATRASLFDNEEKLIVFIQLTTSTEAELRMRSKAFKIACNQWQQIVDSEEN